MPISPIPLNPWAGIDTVHQQDEAVFQPGEGRRAFLTAASNALLLDDGTIIARKAVESLATLTSGLSAFWTGQLLLAQDEGSIYSVNLTTGELTELVSSLDTTDPVRFCTWGGETFWTNREYCGRITVDGVAANWGQAVPSQPVLTAVAGALPAGIYQVGVTSTDANGIESGCSLTTTITLNGSQGISVAVASLDSNAAYVRVYCTRPNGNGQDGLFFSKVVASDALPAVVSDCYVSNYTCKTMGMGPPVPGTGLAAWKIPFSGFLLSWRDEWIYRTSARSSHLVKFSGARTGPEGWRMPGTVRGVGVLQTGLWVATSVGLVWIPEAAMASRMVVKSQDTSNYAQGCLVLEAWKIPALQLQGQVALFVTSGGLVAGTEQGAIRPLTREHVDIGDVTDKRAVIAYVEQDNGYRGVVWNLVDSTDESGDYWVVTNPSPPYTGGTPGDTPISGWNYRTTATSTAAAAGDSIEVTAAGCTITFPVSPSQGDLIQISVGDFVDTIVARNGQLIATDAENFTLDIAKTTTTFEFLGGDQGWGVQQ